MRLLSRPKNRPDSVGIIRVKPFKKTLFDGEIQELNWWRHDNKEQFKLTWTDHYRKRDIQLCISYQELAAILAMVAQRDQHELNKLLAYARGTNFQGELHSVYPSKSPSGDALTSDIKGGQTDAK